MFLFSDFVNVNYVLKGNYIVNLYHNTAFSVMKLS